MPLRDAMETALGKAEYRLLTEGGARLFGFTADAAEIDGVRVPFLVQGWGVPVVFIHGFAADKEGWLLLAAALRARGRSLVLLDLPGFGAAGPIPSARAAANAWQARIVAGLLDRLGYARAHLVGNSMGGGITLRFARDYPARLTSMTLLGSVGPIVVKSEMALALDRGENPLLLESVDDLDRLLAFVLEKPPFPRAMRRYIAHDRFARSDAQAELFRGWIAPRKGEGVPPDLESLQTPALVIHGARDRVIDPFHRALCALAESRLQNARLEILDRVAHAPQLEAPRAVASLVNDFILEAERGYARLRGEQSARELQEAGAS